MDVGMVHVWCEAVGREEDDTESGGRRVLTLTMGRGEFFGNVLVSHVGIGAGSRTRPGARLGQP